VGGGPTQDTRDKAGQIGGTRLSLDALVRSVALRKNESHGLFLGAGASITSGVKSAESCIWEWKRQIFITQNIVLEPQFRDTSLASVRERIQQWLDREGSITTTASARTAASA
jgi:hypothetical protein